MARETDLKDAISQMDVDLTLRLWRDGNDPTTRALENALWECNGLLQKRFSKNFAVRRKEFLKSISLELHQDEQSALRIFDLARVLTLIDTGFAEILKKTKCCRASKLPPIAQVSAGLGWIGEVAEKLQEAANQQVQSEAPVLQMRSTVNIEGAEVDPDAAMYSALRSAVSTILMKSHENNWFNEKDQVLLPKSLPSTSPSECQDILSILELANAWQIWERAQTRLRLAQRLPNYLERPFPPGIPTQVTEVIEVLPDDRVERMDFIANDRLLSRTQQHLVEMLGKKGNTGYPRLGQHRMLPPDGFVSFEEEHGCVSLSESYSFDITADQEEYAGLRLVEWLRGYAVLMELANALAIDPGASWQEHAEFEELDLICSLSKEGLSKSSARKFLQHCCLSKTRNDIYDRPLIRIEGDKYLLMAPSLKISLLGPVVISAISGVGAQIRSKGHRFEKRLLELFENVGHQVAAFTEKRNNEEYDYDALVVWGDFCFLLECKNRTLSSGIVQLAHHGYRENRSHAAQVNRLVGGLLKHPDMLDQHIPSARGKLLVPCVVNALPYVIPDGVDGVYFTDYSSVSRFFKNPVFGEVQVRPGQATKRTEGGEIKRIWVGENPDPTDFLSHIRCPFQYFLTDKHTALQRTATQLFPQEVVVTGEYHRTQIERGSGRNAADLYDREYPSQTESEWSSLFSRIP